MLKNNDVESIAGTPPVEWRLRTVGVLLRENNPRRDGGMKVDEVVYLNITARPDEFYLLKN